MSAHPGATEGERRWRFAVAARHLRLISMAAMRDAIRKTGVYLVTTEVECRLARMADWPFADPVIEIEQCRFASDFGAWLGRHQPTWRCGGGWRRLIARSLTKKSARPDRPKLGTCRRVGRCRHRRRSWRHVDRCRRGTCDGRLASLRRRRFDRTWRGFGNLGCGGLARLDLFLIVRLDRRRA